MHRLSLSVSFTTVNTLLTIDEPSLTYHYHPKFIVYIRTLQFTLGVVHSMHLDKSIITRGASQVGLVYRILLLMQET